MPYTSRIRPQDERRFPRPGNVLKQISLPRRELNGVGCGVRDRRHGCAHVLDPGDVPALAEKAVIHRDVEATAVCSEQSFIGS